MGKEEDLYNAARDGNLEEVRGLLDQGVSVHWANPNYYGRTSLHIASGCGHWEVVKLLLERGAKINALDKNGETALIYAAGNGELEVAKGLIEHGADPTVKNKGGETALDWAQEYGHTEVAQLLQEEIARQAALKQRAAPVLSTSPAPESGSGGGDTSVSDLLALLAQCELTQYEGILTDQGIETLKDLGEASEDDLIEMGIKKFHAKRLIRERGSASETGTQPIDAFLTHNWANDELGRDNHKSVLAINSALKKHGIRTWFDGERMKGQILDQMTRGIDDSRVVVVFITKTYMDKVGGDNAADNCKIEFNYGRTCRPMIAVPMEPRTLDPSKWTGAVRAILGSNLYVCNFAFDCEANPAKFREMVALLAEEIKRLARA